MSNFKNSPFDLKNQKQDKEGTSVTEKTTKTFDHQKNSLLKKDQGTENISSRFSQPATPASQAGQGIAQSQQNRFSQGTAQREQNPLSAGRSQTSPFASTREQSPLASQRAQTNPLSAPRPTSTLGSQTSTLAAQREQKTFDKGQIGQQKPRALAPRQEGNIFQRQESSLDLPTAPASSTMSSIKERLEALQKKQTEKAQKPEPQGTSMFSKGSFIKNKTTAKPPLVSNSSPLGLTRSPLSPAPITSPRPTAQTQSSFAPSPSSQGNVISINETEFAQLSDFLYEQAGIFINENRKYLVENRLTSRLRVLGLHNFSEYLNYLKFDNNRATEMNKFFENMTTNETSFFRNGPQLKVFQDNVLATLCNELRNKKQKKLHIWSAGCSSGEEPYTIAMILHEHLKSEINSWDIKITANDLSLAMLDIAKKGLYSEYALRTTPPEMVNKYFSKKGNQFEVIPEVKKLVRFGQINFANKSQMSKVESSHIVFCRNVIIYFDNEMKTHVINCFYDNLLPSGYLIIGHSESLHNISRSFVPKHYTSAIVYQKKD